MASFELVSLGVEDGNSVGGGEEEVEDYYGELHGLRDEDVMTNGSGYWRVIYACFAPEKDDKLWPPKLVIGLLIKSCWRILSCPLGFSLIKPWRRCW